MTYLALAIVVVFSFSVQLSLGYLVEQVKNLKDLIFAGLRH
jgi:hypothetical protein